MPTLAEPACFDLETWSSSMRVAVTEPSAVDQARARTTAFLDAVDRSCSRFRADSDLIAVCEHAGTPVSVDPLLVTVLTAALAAAEATGGLVTPTVGAALVAAGYVRTFTMLADASPAGVPRAVPEPAPDWRLVSIDPARCSVCVPEGTALDLGATAKAWAADVLAAALADELGCGALVSLGGDLAVAGRPPEGGWSVEVVDALPGHPENPVVLLSEGAVATSSTVKRRWTYEDRSRHHIIDPRTGEPADDVWRTVTVAAARCVDANAASTAAVILGPLGPRWLDEVGLPARLVGRDGDVVTVGDWPVDR